MDETSATYFAAVIGGGPAGSACALRLARLGYPVALIADEPGARVGETGGPRLTRTMDRSGISLRRDIGWPVERFHSVWGSADEAVRDEVFWHATGGRSLPRPVFDRHLQDAAAEVGATVFRNVSAAGVICEADRFCIHLRHVGRSATCVAEFIIEASGRRTRSVVHPDASRYFVDGLVCASVLVDLPARMTASAIVEAVPTGWFYVVPFEGRHVLCFFTDADLLTARPDASFLRQMLASSSLLAGLTRVDGTSGVGVRDARTSIRTLLWRGKWIVAGDAAWTLDPLSGDGIERAVDSGTAAADAIVKAFQSKSSRPLRQYAVASAEKFRRLLAARHDVYGREMRWRQAPFWRSRALAVSLGSS
ncbi:NAD(P)/FAD-dependent oxidoreductase [Mesorhizobium sp. M0871]|uniref:NAD(P)/FAD-dependent oxidoreductase n=1 Tax=unclassified Mesorhizobium TaxID=325217 RepID=UPI0003D0471E|nr:MULTISPECIES: NAD(P)/FAD-dependent oxidoreductase [unclassified Mesorhizobium]ESZ02732.1 hypothetical protein X736_29210 [Mesorhizobium sp. L2C089B000]ESZ51688.1 hypothetical protein X731_03620 [Mesorhizobium sp. L2C054A000]WJI50536.1 NAD(P)/FAD-dependent oxidoreductase [Mesorhizobium sp. C089B]